MSEEPSDWEHGNRDESIKCIHKSQIIYEINHIRPAGDK